MLKSAKARPRENEGEWNICSLPTSHDAMIESPNMLAECLLAIAC